MPANATAYLDTGLTPGDSYSYQVLASNTVGNTASNTATVTTPVPPLAVSALQPNSVAHDQRPAELGAQFNGRHRRANLAPRRRRRQLFARDDFAGRLDELC